MISTPDFKMKQIIFVLASEGEKLCVKNDNLLVIDKEGNTKLQCTCYRLFLINIIGNTSLTTPLIQKAKKFGFYIALYTTGFHLFQIIGACKEGNVLLKKKQYNYHKLAIAKTIVKNKIANQYITLKSNRNKDDKEVINKMVCYYREIDSIDDMNILLAYEGLAAKVYFKSMFKEYNWKGRKPRVKMDIINVTLDIGYTILFNFIDAIVSSFGFDTYVGVYHKEFYMRKSLICDLVEPFRPLIDKAIRKGLNLGEIKENDFDLKKNQYCLKWKNNKRYISLLMNPVVQNKEIIFQYVQSYYRTFMKYSELDHDYPQAINGEIVYGTYKL